MGPPQSWFCHEDGTTCLPLMGPPGWLVCQLWDHPGVASGLSGCSAAVLADELPGGISDRDCGDAAAVAAGVGVAGSSPIVGYGPQDGATVRRPGTGVRSGPRWWCGPAH